MRKIILYNPPHSSYRMSILTVRDGMLYYKHENDPVSSASCPHPSSLPNHYLFLKFKKVGNGETDPV